MSASDGSIVIDMSGLGKNQRERVVTIGGRTVYEDVVTVDDGNGNLIDPRQIRALTSTDVVTAMVSAGTGITLSVSQSSVPNPPNLDVALSTRLKIADFTMAAFFSYGRWGIPREPSWVDGSEATAPGAGAALVSQTVTSGKTGRVFGINITADEANRFQFLVGSTVVKDFELGAAGTIFIVVQSPLKDSIAASSVITIKNVNAGASGKVYQASLLYDEA